MDTHTTATSAGRTRPLARFLTGIRNHLRARRAYLLNAEIAASLLDHGLPACTDPGDRADLLDHLATTTDAMARASRVFDNDRTCAHGFTPAEWITAEAHLIRLVAASERALTGEAPDIPDRPVSAGEVVTALRQLDIPALQRAFTEGWTPQIDLTTRPGGFRADIHLPDGVTPDMVAARREQLAQNLDRATVLANPLAELPEARMVLHQLNRDPDPVRRAELLLDLHPVVLPIVGMQAAEILPALAIAYYRLSGASPRLAIRIVGNPPRDSKGASPA